MQRSRHYGDVGHMRETRLVVLKRVLLHRKPVAIRSNRKSCAKAFDGRSCRVCQCLSGRQVELPAEESGVTQVHQRIQRVMTVSEHSPDRKSVHMQ